MLEIHPVIGILYIAAEGVCARTSPLYTTGRDVDLCLPSPLLIPECEQMDADFEIVSDCSNPVVGSRFLYFVGTFFTE